MNPKRKAALYEQFLKRLQEIREYEWNNYDLKIHKEHSTQRGVRAGENALQAIARNMQEALEENQ